MEEKIKSLRFRKNSIFKRLFVVIAILSVIQIFLFSLIIRQNNIMDDLRQSKINITENVVKMRKDSLESKMTGTWAELNSWDKAIDDLKALDDSGEIHRDNMQVARIVLSLLENSMTTGAFYVSLEENEKGGYDAVYFKDENPDAYSIAYSDVYIEYGKNAVAKKLGITMDSNWRAYGDNQFVSMDYIRRPVDAYAYNPGGDETDYGYWSVGELPYNRGVMALMYTLPLIGADDSVFGVLGVEINLEYIGSMLKYEELILEEHSAYILALNYTDTGIYVPVVVKGHEYSGAVSRQGEFMLIPDSHMEDVWNSDWLDDSELFFKQDIRTYRANTPFVNQQWCLIGIQNADRLFADENTFAQMILLFEIVAFLISIIGSVVASSIISRPIRRITAEIEQTEQGKLPVIKRASIYEIDTLLDTIENMAIRLVDAASRISVIIKAAKIPLGVVEVDYSTGECFMTASFCSVMGFDEIEDDFLFLERAELDMLMKGFYERATIYQEGSSESEESSIYEILDEKSRPKWVALTNRNSSAKKIIIVTDVTDTVLKNIQLEYEVSHDELSKLYNIKAFRKEVENRLVNREPEFALMGMWDLDNLKYINDNYGHEYGDIYIKQAAMCLGVIEMKGGIVARRSGDEFYAYMDGDNKEELMALFAETHKTLCSAEIGLPDNEKQKLRASAGVAWFPQDAKSFSELSKRADFAMYSAKHSRKGTLMEFSAEAYKRDEILISGNEELNRIIENSMLAMAYQPIVDAITGEVYAYEALMRPKSERFKSPMDLIRIAKAQARINDIELLTWDTVLPDFFYKKANERKDACLFVNSFPNGVLPDDVIERNDKLYGDFYKYIVTEITEAEDMNEGYMEKKRMYADAVGSRFALDDYGSGFNSELKLIQLHPEFVKIDKALVDGITTDKYRQELVRNTISYCKTHGIKVIAEGMEQEEQLRYMIAAGADYVQGYYLARPSEKLPTDAQLSEIQDRVMKSREQLELQGNTD